MFERFFSVLQGVMRLFVSKVEQNHPEALLENEKENVRTQLTRFNEGLVSHAAMCERLIDQVKKLEREQEDLHVRVTVQLKAGHHEAAAELALRHQTITRELDENRLQAEAADQTYHDLVRARDNAVDTARRKIEALRRGIDEMRVQQAMAELNQMAAGLVTSVGGAGETLHRLEEMISDQRSRAAGVTRVARDQLSLDDVATQQQEHDALAHKALADFAAREGLSLDAEPGESPAAEDGAITKTMGPAESEN